MKKKSQKRAKGRPPVGAIRNVKVSDEDWERWEQAALLNKQNRSEWIRETLNNAADALLNQ